MHKFNPNGIISTAYFDGATKVNMIKRFKIETSTVDKKFHFITEHKASKLLAVSDNYAPDVQIKAKPDGKNTEISLLPIDELVEVRGWKAIGNKLNFNKLTEIEFIATETEEVESEELKVENAELKVESNEIESEKLKVESVVEEDEPEFVINNLEEKKTEDEPEFIVNMPQIEEESGELKVESEKEEIPFEIKNLNADTDKGSAGEQLGLF